MYDSENLVKRLNRVEGQVQAIIRMVEKKDDCLPLLFQILAAKNALAKVAVQLLVAESCKLQSNGKTKDFENVISKLLTL